MKANDLRIGNIVFRHGFEVIIDSIQENLIAVKEESFYNPITYFKPIPLTEEWLVKFNFKQKKVKWSDGSISTDLFWNDNYFIGMYGDYNAFSRLDYNGQVFLRNINFVHELQNLYYCLTGKELEIQA